MKSRKWQLKDYPQKPSLESNHRKTRVKCQIDSSEGILYMEIKRVGIAWWSNAKSRVEG